MRPFVAGLSLLTVVLAEAPTRAAPAPCDAIEVEYALDGELRLEGTPMGKGDGVYRIGPGTATVRFQTQDGVPTGPAELVAYEMTERFLIDSHALFWEARVATDARTTVAEDSCGVAARGALSGRRLDWTSDVRGSRTDGHLTCDGSLCGKFGAPPAGVSPLHVAAHGVRFAPWSFTPDLTRFTMPSSWTARTESPRQTSYVSLAGREVRRGCAPSTRCSR